MHDKKQKKTNSRTELMMESGNEKRNRNKSRNQTEISNYGKRVREKREESEEREEKMITHDNTPN